MATPTPAVLDYARPRGFSISAVLPAYNEEQLIEHTVRRVAAVLAQLVDRFEIVVTDDGSHDATGTILARLSATEEDLHLRVVTHPMNRGYGAALASGFDAASLDLILLLDADGQFDVAELVHLLAAMDDDTDLVIGFRAHRADPWLRKLNALGWKTLVNVLFGYTARDIDCAFKLFRREVWTSMRVGSRGAAFSAELLVKARRLGFRTKEVPVSHFPRTAGAPTGANPRVIARAFAELFQLRLRLDDELAADRQRASVGRLGHIPV
ncbi:MAG: glycosyltransferase family 2 protein [Chloroflexi bacterium]|nr:glycosyltransferase family 2 protein [Chloroflexota bacterium]